MTKTRTTQITKPAQTEPMQNGHTSVRLAYIEKPKGLFMRFVYWVNRRKFGKVPDGLKVVIPRVPKLLNIGIAAQKLEKSLHVDKETVKLVTLEVATINGCGACVDFDLMTVVVKDMNMEKFNAIAEYRTNPLFSARQRAALAYAGEVTRTRNASDATFDTLKQHFNDQEIAELTVVIALQNMANLINVPLGIGSDGLCAIMQSKKHQERL